MGRTVELRTALQTLLLTKCNKVFYQRAKEGQSGNYLVYTVSLPTITESNGQGELEVNVIGRGDDTTSVENLTDELITLLDHYYYKTETLQFSCYPSGRISVTEEDKTIIRRRLTFTLLIH